MKAIIPAAGYATRLYPLTENTPKALLRVGDKPMIEHTMARLDELADVDEVFLVTNSRFYAQFVQWRDAYVAAGAAVYKGNDKIHLARRQIHIFNNGTTSNQDRRGAVGDIGYAISEGHIDDDVIVLATDNLFTISLQQVVQFGKERAASAVAGVHLPLEIIAGKFGNILTDDAARIIAFAEKPKQPTSTIAATFIYYFTRDDVHEVTAYLAAGKNPDNGGDFIRHLATQSAVFCPAFHGGWYDVGGLAELNAADKEYGGNGEYTLTAEQFPISDNQFTLASLQQR